MAADQSAARHEYDVTRPLLRTLVSGPVTSTATLPMPLVPDGRLGARARGSADAAQEQARRSALPPADRDAQDAFRRRLAERLAPLAAEPSRPSAAAARSRSTTVRRTPSRQAPPAQRTAEQPPHQRHQPGAGRGQGHGPGT
ncbi:hypothetical protein [Streptomyces naphthomycinicus]|uniref:hypothetical protein n=1 Tax=Streptomyces naphthomycinicus TaxID=2872625 RepID=UPI001CEDF87D|nr:hypothetical protein [Streptomyces sp. TML10]